MLCVGGIRPKTRKAHYLVLRLFESEVGKSFAIRTLMYTQTSKSLTTGHRMLPVTKKKGRQRSTRFYSLVPGDYGNGT